MACLQVEEVFIQAAEGPLIPCSLFIHLGTAKCGEALHRRAWIERPTQVRELQMVWHSSQIARHPLCCLLAHSERLPFF